MLEDAGTSGQVLTSDGTNWTSADAAAPLPAVGPDGNVLTSDGTDWASEEIDALPAAGVDGQVLTSDGTNWVSEEIDALPAVGAAGQVLTSNGTNWASAAAAVDLTAIRQDIAMLALYNAVSDNRAAYNLPHSFIDQFEDNTGTATRTDVSDAAGEFFASISSVSGAHVNDIYTSLLIHSDESNGFGTFTDSSSNGHTIEKQGTITHSTGVTPEIGATSIALNGSNGLKIPWHSSLQFDADFTLEFNFYQPASPTTGDRLLSHWPDHHNSNGGQWFLRATSAEADAFNYAFGGAGSHATSGEYYNTSAWNHVAAQRDGSNITVYINGTKRIDTGCNTGTTGDRQYITVGYYYGGPTEFPASGTYIDEIRISKGIARYKSPFTPPIDSVTTSPTGTLVSDVQTAPVATTKMSGVILYKDNIGSATTLGTHLKIYLTANLQGTTPNWTNTDWTEVVAADYGAVTSLFSAGVKMVRLAEQTVVSGTACAMKAVWATQESGVRETQLHGWAMNY